MPPADSPNTTSGVLSQPRNGFVRAGDQPSDNGSAGPADQKLTARGQSFQAPPLPPEMYINRELSWLEFNRRVLEEAEDEATPLLERVKFAAIFASNLDEFFMIRVAGLKRKVAAGITDPGSDGRTPQAAQAAVRRTVQELLDRHADLVRTKLLPNLAAHGVLIVPYGQLDAHAQRALAETFEREIFPILTPQAIDRARRFPHVSNQSLNLIVVLKSPDNGVRYARVKVPAILPRLVAIPECKPDDSKPEPVPVRFAWLEQVIAAHLPRLFPGNEISAVYPFHVLRDSDFDVDDDDEDANDLLLTLREFLSQRSFGSVVQVITDSTMPENVRTWLIDQLHAGERDSYIVDGPLACENLMALALLDRPDLKDPPFLTMPVSALAACQRDSRDPDDIPAEDIFTVIRRGDVLIHHPYHSFSTVTDFLRAAATDRNVVAIKQTLYRIGKDSPLIPVLIEARDDDTQVAVLVELKARFDEENNISWAQQLEHHGIHVAYGVEGLKTHCKATLVVRREEGGLRRYAHLSTGNYNAATARIYEDIGLLTARDDICGDLSDLFNVLTGFSHQDTFRTLWVAPTRMRERFIAAIAREAEIHRRTGGGHLIFKMNSLVDREIIRALYGASQAGVKIDLIIRGVCCLRPGVPGWSDNIRVISVVGRFLEHSRIYYFRNGGDDEVYLGSADLMERNLDRRVEVVFPIADPRLKAQIRDTLLPIYLGDTVSARELQPNGSYRPVTPRAGDPPQDAQRELAALYASEVAPSLR
jgi:polyphosphate kinase